MTLFLSMALSQLIDYMNMMKPMLPHLLFLIVGMQSQAEVIDLDDFEVYPININQPLEPSGLTLKGGQLFTVCDDSNTIFELLFSEDSEVQAVPHIKMDVSPLSAMNLDLEGITFVNNEFFVVSESHHKLVKINSQGLSWVPDLGSVYQSAYQQGLFQIYNAGLEAAVYLGDHTFLMSVERQPRGLIEVKLNEDFTAIIKQTNQLFDDSNHPLESTRKPDLTGLFLYDGDHPYNRRFR